MNDPPKKRNKYTAPRLLLREGSSSGDPSGRWYRPMWCEHNWCLSNCVNRFYLPARHAGSSLSHETTGCTALQTECRQMSCYFYATDTEISYCGRETSGKLAAENKQRRRKVFSQCHLPFKDRNLIRSSTCQQDTFPARDLPIGFLSKNKTGAFRIDSNILLCNVWEALTRT